jgi:hypothetical protein
MNGRLCLVAVLVLSSLAGAKRGRAAEAPGAVFAPPSGSAATAPAGSTTAPASSETSSSTMAPPLAGMPGSLPPPVAPPPVTVASRPSPPIVIPIAAASDHDAVVGHWGIEARRFTSARFPLSLRADRGCPTAAVHPCTVEMGALGVRYWSTRNLALNGGLVLAMGGGREDARSLDTYIGGGPIVGMTLLLGNWKHLAIGATPELSVVVFKPGGGTTHSTTLVDVRGSLEGELHFGFIGVPALSIGLASGLVFHYESAPTFRVWSVGLGGASSVWGALTNLFIRYYL